MSNLLLRAVSCTHSYRDNVEYRIYYEPPGRSARPYEYLGIYKDKAVRGIGRVVNRVRAELDEMEVVILESEGPVQSREKARIRGIIKATEVSRGMDIRTGREFVLMDEIHPTLFEKTTPGGLRTWRYFDLAEIFGPKSVPPADQIAGRLWGQTWDTPAHGA